MAIISWTYNVTDSADSSVLEGVNIWASSDLGGQTVLDTGVTDVNGDVTLSLEEDSDVYLWHSLSGYTFTNPNLQTVTDGVDGAGEGTAVVAPVPDAVVLSTTARDLISDALMECGILAQGEDAQAEDADTGHKRLNRMIEQWNTQRAKTYMIRIARHTLTANQTSHTIGPSGDFVTERPVRIVRANIVVTGYTPEMHYPVRIIERAEEWARVTAPGLATNVPTELFCDYGFPDATLFLWPYPTTAYDLELFTWEPLSTFNTLDSAVILPPGYYDALMYSLAERLCSPFGVPAETRALIAHDARWARARIEGVNMKAPMISTIGDGIPTTESL